MSDFFELLIVSRAMYDLEPASEPASELASEPASGPASDSTGVSKPKVFSQEDVNKFLADDRRKNATKHEARQAELETAYKEALANQSLSQETRGQLEGKLEDLQKTFRSKEQQLEYDKKQLETKYTEEVQSLKQRAENWENKYKSSMVDRALQDAAIKNDAFNPGQVTTILKTMTKIIEKTDENGEPLGEFAPVIDLTDIDAKTGEQIITRRTPEDAVKRMRELPQQYGNLFNKNVVSGIGAGSATGSGVSGHGNVDIHNMSPEQYMELRKTNPAALGLK